MPIDNALAIRVFTGTATTLDISTLDDAIVAHDKFHARDDSFDIDDYGNPSTLRMGLVSTTVLARVRYAEGKFHHGSTSHEDFEAFLDALRLVLKARRADRHSVDAGMSNRSLIYHRLVDYLHSTGVSDDSEVDRITREIILG